MKFNTKLHYNYHFFCDFNNILKRDSVGGQYILSFTTSSPFLLGGIEWVRLTVLGQSFLLVRCGMVW